MLPQQFATFVFMKYIFSFVLTLFVCSISYGQAVLCPELLMIANGDTILDHLDTLNCGTPCATLVAPANTDLAGTNVYSVTSVTYAPYSFTTGTDVPETGAPMAPVYDDQFSDIIALPFSFCFFGVTYTNIVVGTNGNATFNVAQADLYDPWPIGGPIPGSNCAATENCIMAPWNDLYPIAGGTIKYETYGIAPCRQFVISWNNDALFDPGICPAQYSTQQIVLYESSNIIDVYINHRAPCTAWNNGYAVTGIENNAGTTFYTAPAENGTTFTATNEGWRFTPAGPISGWNYTWYDSTLTTVLASGPSDTLVVCPTVNDARYYVKATAIACAGVTIWDSIKLIKSTTGAGLVDSTAFGNPTTCIASNGWILLHGLVPLDTFSLTYTYNGSPVGPITVYPTTDSDIYFGSLPAGVYNTFIFYPR